jgi:hypothetical protein
LGLETQGLYWFRHGRCPTSSSEECFICPRGLVVVGTSLGRESVCPQISLCDDELRVLSESGIVFDLRM